MALSAISQGRCSDPELCRLEGRTFAVGCETRWAAPYRLDAPGPPVDLALLKGLLILRAVVRDCFRIFVKYMQHGTWCNGHKSYMYM